MSNFKFILFIVASIFAVQRLSAQNTQASNATEDSVHLINRPISVTFIPPMGTNGLEAGRVKNNISLNIFAGYHGGLEGIEMAGFSNVLRYDMKGIQLAGFSNTVLGESYGSQFAGFANYTRKYTAGVQASGFANVVTDSADAFQGASFANVVTGDLKGVQAAGFSNFVGGSTKGAQFASFANLSADSVVGAQIAGFANVTPKDLKGFQASGFVNVARKVNGIQLGLININDTVESGAAIGFVNISKRGVWDLELEYSDAFHTSAQLKTGSERLYSIFSLGIAGRNKTAMWGYGYGLGTMFPVHNKLKINVDLMSYQIQEGTFSTRDFNQLNRLKLQVAHPIAQNAKVYGGPTFNMLISTMEDEYGELTGGNFAPYHIFNESYNRTNVKMWPGFTAGIRF
ncbi:MAG: hypothetical protein KDC92_06305 [Bacteroidetes bacterium]|nr:hypothetical protein [Bacteroidota bacterium]